MKNIWAVASAARFAAGGVATPQPRVPRDSAVMQCSTLKCIISLVRSMRNTPQKYHAVDIYKDIINVHQTGSSTEQIAIC